MEAPKNVLALLRWPWARVLLEALGLIAALWILNQLSGVLTPVIIGLVLAYMLDPLVTGVARRGIPRRYAAGAVFGGGVLLLVGVFAVGIPVAWHEGAHLYRVATAGDAFVDANGDGAWQPGEAVTRDLNGNGRWDRPFIDTAKHWLVERKLLQADSDEGQPSWATLDPDEWRRRLTEEWQQRGLIGRVAAIFGLIGWWAVTILLIPVYGYFFSLHLQAVSAKIVAHIPRRQRERTLRILGEINQVAGAFFRGRIAICLILAVVAALGFWIARVPSFLVLGLLMGLGTAIPLAAGLTLLPVALLLMMNDASTWQYVVAGGTFGVVQLLEPLLIAAIMGKGVEMHPVLIIVAILAFGTLLGGIGVLLAVPLAATFRILYIEFIYPHVRRLAGLDEDTTRLDPPPAPPPTVT